MEVGLQGVCLRPGVPTRIPNVSIGRFWLHWTKNAFLLHTGRAIFCHKSTIATANQHGQFS